VAGGGSPDCINPFKSAQSAVTWTFGADYQVSDKTMVYVTGRRGFKGGGYQSNFVDINRNQYKPEYIEDVEIGLKSDWRLGGIRGRISVDAFRGTETDIQRLVNYEDPLVGPTAYIANSATAVVQGVEFEGTVIPVRGLDLNLKYAYTHAAYDKANAAALCAPVTTEPAFCPLNPLQDTPRHQLTFSAHYTFPTDPEFGKFTIGGSLYYQSKAALTDAGYAAAQAGNAYTTIEPAYHLVNLDATWANVMGQPFDLAFFMTNATNKLYRVGSNDLSYNLGFASYMYGEPRMFGMRLRYHFHGG